MKFKRITLTDKFVLLFIAMGVVAAGAVSVATYYQAKSALTDRTFNQLTSVKSVKKRQIETFFNERIGDAEFLSDFLSRSTDRRASSKKNFTSIKIH
jgi:methyl-accepting chemotaxis protein